jgi:tRNA(Ile)-lysidine synthase
MALLLSASTARPGYIHAVSVDHALRAQSAQELAQVAAWLEAKAIPHSVLAWQGRKPKANIQETAREARYALLTKWCEQEGFAFLATGHHADDVAETFLMRLAHGSGLQGLASLRAKRVLTPKLTLLRPLLGFNKAHCQAYLQTLNQPWLEDPSNSNPAFDRTQARVLLRSLAEIGLDASKLAQTAHWLRESADFIEQAACIVCEQAEQLEQGVLSIPCASLTTPRVVLRIALSHWLQKVGGKAKPARGGDIERLLDKLNRPDFRKATLAGCLLIRQRGTLTIMPERAKT